MSEVPSYGPERDRRRRKRILTKKSVGITILVFVAIFIAISVWSEVSDTASFGKGRLFSSRMNIPELPERKPYEVVGEEDVSASPGADPLLLDYQRREQMLGVEPGMLEKQHGINPDAPSLDARDSVFADSLGDRSPTDSADVAITGGPEGVRIEKKQ